MTNEEKAQVHLQEALLQVAGALALLGFDHGTADIQQAREIIAKRVRPPARRSLALAFAEGAL